MERRSRRLLAIGAAVTLMFAVIACAGASDENSEVASDSGVALDADEQGESERPAEHADGREGEGAESDGDHREGSEHGEGGEGEHDEGSGGEHGEEGGHSDSEGGEESGIYIARNETWDGTRRGARLVLKFDAERGAFVGTVENTTEQTICDVRVEVHLDTPEELGPARTDVPAGAKIDVELSAEGNSFQTWTAHPEVSSCSDR